MIPPGLAMPGAAQTVASLTAGVAGAFTQGGLPDAALEARWLVAGLLAGDEPDRRVPPDAALVAVLPPTLPDTARFMQRLNAAIARRLSGEPLDRILGTRAFWTLELALSPATLSPRPDTETLVNAGLDLLRARAPSLPPPRLLDLGTGTGAILLALLSELPEASGIGIDLSAEAVATATANAARAGLAGRAAFRIGDWFAGLAERFDLIVSNPPYIPTGDLAGLSPEVRDHDPVLALDGGADGLDAYRRIAAGLPHHLAPGGHAVIEAGAGQANDIAAIFAQAGYLCLARRRDLGGHERALVFKAR